MRKVALITCLLFFVLAWCLPAQSQEITVSGTVINEVTKNPIEGASVHVQGTKKMIQTNAAGKFTIKAPVGATLVISSVEFEKKSITVKAATVTVALTSLIKDLDEVVVAMDIKRKPRELGYSVQKVDGKDISETQRDNFLNSLNGRIAGATVTPSSGVPGSSSTIVLRGFNSMSLSNQPLFVVDGIIMDNSTVEEGALASSRGSAQNADFTNRIADINPADIESITVLKGPEATVLYGSLASSGAIVITTRKPKAANGKVNLAYDNSIRFQSLKQFPPGYDAFQNGTNGARDASKLFAFGPAYAPETKLYDNINNFFQTSFGQTHNISAEFGVKNSNFRLSGSYYEQEGVVPNTKVTRYTVKLTNTTKINKFIDITPSIAFTHSNNKKVARGAGSYLMSLYLWPADRDVTQYLDDSTGKKLFIVDESTDPIDNPFFSVYRNPGRDINNRVSPSFSINANPFKWLTLSGRFGYDTYRQEGYLYKDPQANGYTANKGVLDNYYYKYYSYNHTITATARHTIGKFNGRLTVGTRWNEWQKQNYAVYGFRDSIRSFDSAATDPTTRTRLTMAKYGQWNKTKFAQMAEFAEATIGFNNVIFLTASMSFETASVFPKDYRNYSYPGGSLSIIMSDLIPALKRNESILSYWKLRGSLASTARLSDPYSNQSVFLDADVSSNLPLNYQYGFTNNNEFLKPERQKTYEIGTELKMIKNRLSIDFAYYNTLCTDQIAQGFRASYGTGYVLNTQNNSSIRNEGVEITTNVEWVKAKDFSWNTQFNFNKMWGKVLSIPAPIAQGGGDYYFSNTWIMGVRAGLIEGGSTGTLTSLEYDRNAKGDLLIDPNTGLTIVSTAVYKPHGNRSPNFRLGTINKFRYKTWNLSFLWDLRIGGDVYNGTSKWLTQYGKTRNTADRMTPRVIEGVLKDGNENTANPTKNTIAVTPYYNYNYYQTTATPDENYIERNINCLRLRDITLSYSCSPALVQRLKLVKSLSFFVTCNDLLLFTNYSGADPEANGGNASVRGVGAFGVDYGNIGTPLSFNIGLRTSFK